VKVYTDICRVKYALNLIYILSAATLLHEANSGVAERNRISRNEAAKIAARDADEVAQYKDKLWFQAHARHTWDESSRGTFLLRRTDGSIAAARNTKKPTTPEPEGINPRCGGTKYGRPSFYNGAPYRRGAA
jgi:hypothetical protein